MNQSHFKHLLILCMTVLATACISNPTQRTYYYVINPVPADTTIQVKDNGIPSPALEIVSLSLPQYLDRPQIVTRSTAHQLKINDYHRWGGNLRKNITSVIAKNLSNHLGTPNIFVVPHVSQSRITHRLMIEILAFEKGPGQIVSLSTRWTLADMDKSTANIVKVQDMQFKLAEGAKIEDTVDAMGQLLGKLSQHIAETINRDAN